MKLVKFLLPVALFLSSAGHAQSSQTYHFGEGQSAPQGGRAASPPPSVGTESIRRQHHRHHTTRHSSRQSQYSRP